MISRLRAAVVRTVSDAIGWRAPWWIPRRTLEWIRDKTCPCGRYKWTAGGSQCGTCGRLR